MLHLHCRYLSLSALLTVLAIGSSHAADEGRSPTENTGKSLDALAPFDGAWRGPARTLNRNGQFVELIQTERVGPLLSGAIRLVEGRGHSKDGTVRFNALGIFSFNADVGKYNFHSYAMGHEGDFPLTVVPGGFTWEVPAGPAKIRYSAKVEGDEWIETGDRLVDGQPPMRIFEMRLRRVGSTDWPQAGGIAPQ